MLKMKKFKNQSGQSLTEYVLMLFIIASAAFLLFGPMKNLLALMEQPLRKEYRRLYKYGDPKACGYNDTSDSLCTGEPQRHPRYNVAENFRTFGRGK